MQQCSIAAWNLECEAQRKREPGQDVRVGEHTEGEDARKHEPYIIEVVLIEEKLHFAVNLLDSRILHFHLGIRERAMIG